MTHRILLLTALVLLSDGFNLETEKATIFQDNARSFGHSVVQLEGSRFVVGAPQEIRAANQTGGLYQCDYSTGKCESMHLQVPLEAVNMSLGLSLAFATSPFRLLACGPTVHQTCKENTYVNGLCFLFGPNLWQQPQTFPEKLRECPRQDSDIVFLIDGSGSIIPSDFQRMKNFVSTVMNRFKKSKTLVGDAFNSPKNREELNTIASKPPRDHVFRVNNFEALKTIQNQLQEKIFAIEGTQTGSTSSFEHEMSQEGFSAAITANGLLLGAVGSFDWAGGAFLHVSKDKFTFINTTRVDSDMNDAYLGYAAEVILRSRVQNLVLGAPRYQHTGLVVIFRENAGTWETNALIKGSQVSTGHVEYKCANRGSLGAEIPGWASPGAMCIRVL
uniref:Integrin alpha-M-like isoform X2 n=1 Tax=Callorhinus ursinus TaxID=34884 RepID=A0A3Q7P2Q9_CALUR|nr:integrin alpha-M-like isoform X2 [Callorhinus ursinus]